MSEKRYGHMEITGKDIAVASTPIDRLALSGRGELLLVSVIAATQTIKQIAAILRSGTRVKIACGGARVKQPSQTHMYAQQPGNIFASADGYLVYTHRMDFGQAHALMITKAPGFMRIVTDETIWQELTDNRFSTPVLREWVPYISRQMRERDILEEAHCFNCNCGYMSATTTSLDEIVSEGIRTGSIYIPSAAAAA